MLTARTNQSPWNADKLLDILLFLTHISSCVSGYVSLSFLPSHVFFSFLFFPPVLSWIPARSALVSSAPWGGTVILLLFHFPLACAPLSSLKTFAVLLSLTLSHCCMCTSITPSLSLSLSLSQRCTTMQTHLCKPQKAMTKDVQQRQTFRTNEPVSEGRRRVDMDVITEEETSLISKSLTFEKALQWTH